MGAGLMNLNSSCIEIKVDPETSQEIQDEP